MIKIYYNENPGLEKIYILNWIPLVQMCGWAGHLVFVFLGNVCGLEFNCYSLRCSIGSSKYESISICVGIYSFIKIEWKTKCVHILHWIRIRKSDIPV